MRACPFCGSTKLIMALPQDAGEAFFIECDDCDAMGPNADSPQEALDGWAGTKPAPQPATCATPSPFCRCAVCTERIARKPPLTDLAVCPECGSTDLDERGNCWTCLQRKGEAQVDGKLTDQKCRHAERGEVCDCATAKLGHPAAPAPEAPMSNLNALIAGWSIYEGEREQLRKAESADLDAVVKAWRERCEKLEVQLAGCDVAALGGVGETVMAKQGDYGWSVSYRDVLDLRRRYERVESELAASKAAGSVEELTEEEIESILDATADSSKSPRTTRLEAITLVIQAQREKLARKPTAPGEGKEDG